MNAQPILVKVATVLDEARLEVVMIGNAAAALQGAPVTTLDFDFMFRKTRTNMKKLKVVAGKLDAIILKPFYPLSNLYRVVDENGGLQLDFMSAIHGIESFASLRSKSTVVDFSGKKLLIASLTDIAKSKRATGRQKDLAVLPILEKTINEKASEE